MARSCRARALTPARWIRSGTFRLSSQQRQVTRSGTVTGRATAAPLAIPAELAVIPGADRRRFRLCFAAGAAALLAADPVGRWIVPVMGVDVARLFARARLHAVHAVPP